MAYQYSQQPYGAPPPQQGHGQPGQYGAPPPPAQYGQYGQQQPQQYGQPQKGHYGAPPGAPPPPPHGAAAPPYCAQGQYAAQGQYGAPTSQGQYGAPPPPAPAYGGGGGYGAPSAKPPNADPQLWSWYTAVDADRSGQISPPELQQALINGDWSPFSLETVQLMMTLFDADGSGTIGFDEFVSLWKYIEDWKRIFQQFDADRSGRIDRNELRQALQAFGYNITPKVIDLLITKFARKDITFDAFISCCVTIKSLSEAFARVDTDRDGWVNMSHELFLELVIGSRQ
ncbi:hypothetical protein HDU87_003473 [Geranomyces variabilis]|uniref:EF-hand domain-containing protein n=1 Tax=Geranomyces variabilis TaxID=109894 RepID=A0AAD5XSL9_9FUNG|nr:hypothetical protein HDU87_003473 [Geranomyces variabilis]